MSYEKSYFSDKMDYSEFEQRQEDQLKIRNRNLLDDLSLHAMAKKRLLEIAEEIDGIRGEELMDKSAEVGALFVELKHSRMKISKRSYETKKTQDHFNAVYHCIRADKWYAKHLGMAHEKYIHMEFRMLQLSVEEYRRRNILDNLKTCIKAFRDRLLVYTHAKDIKQVPDPRNVADIQEYLQLAQHELGDVLWKNDQYEEAKTAFEESLRQCKNFFGAGDIRQIKALSCLGRLHSDTGWKESKPESAMLFLESAYEKSKVWLGERHKMTLYLITWVARARYNLKEYKTAARFLVEAQRKFDEVFGHVEIQNKHHFSRPLLFMKQSVLAATATLPKDYCEHITHIRKLHPEFAIAEEFQATMEDKSLTEETRFKNYGDILVRFEEMKGKDHEDVWVMESVVARELRERGRNEEAKIIYERVLKKQLEVVGESNHETIWTWMHLATCLMRLENFDQAIIYYNKAVKANRRLLGNQHPKTCLSWTKLGRIYYTMGDYTQAEAFYQLGVKGYSEELKERQSKDTVSFESGDVKCFKKERNNCLKLFKQCINDPKNQLVQEFEEHMKEDMPLEFYERQLKKHNLDKGYKNAFDYSLIVVELARVHDKNGNYEVALEFYKEARDVMRPGFGKNDERTLRCEVNLATCEQKHNEEMKKAWEELGMVDKEKPFNHDLAEERIKKLKDFVRKMEKLKGKDYDITIAGYTVLSNMLWMSEDEENRKESVKNYHVIVERQTRRYGDDSKEVLRTLHNIGTCVHVMGAESGGKGDLQAISCFKYVYDKRAAKLGPKDTLTLTVLRDRANVYRVSPNPEVKNLDKCEPLMKEAMDGLIEKLGLEHPDTRITIKFYAYCLEKMETRLDELKAVLIAYPWLLDEEVSGGVWDGIESVEDFKKENGL